MAAVVDYNVWLDRPRFEDAECAYQEHLARLRSGGSSISTTQSACKASPQNIAVASASDCPLLSRIEALEKENREFRKFTGDLQKTVASLTSRLSALEKTSSQPAAAPKKEPEPEAASNDDEDDFELFGSDEEEEADEEAERIRQERLKAYEEKKSKKPTVVAKSNIVLDVKPWDDETDMAKLEECVRSIEMDGLLWGASKFVPLAYGIKKLQISCVVEDEKVSTDDLEEQIVGFEDYIQSMDIAAFNKI